MQRVAYPYTMLVSNPSEHEHHQTFPWSCNLYYNLYLFSFAWNDKLCRQCKTRAWRASLLGTGSTFDTCTYEIWFMSIEPCLMMMNKSREMIPSRSTRQLPITELWMDIVNKGHRHDCDCHQHTVGFNMGTDTRCECHQHTVGFWGKALCCQCFQRSTLPRSSHLLFLSSFQQSSTLSYWLKGEVAWSAPRLYLGHGRHTTCPCQVLGNNDATFA